MDRGKGVGPVRGLSILTFVVLLPDLAYFSILKREATRSSETSLKMYRIVRHYMPEDGNLPSFHREYLKSHEATLCL
jgi:hypothetical protein